MYVPVRVSCNGDENELRNPYRCGTGVGRQKSRAVGEQKTLNPSKAGAVSYGRDEMQWCVKSKCRLNWVPVAGCNKLAC